MDTSAKSQAVIKVIGVGGSGGSAINWMAQSKVKGVEFLAINTDAQALHHSLAGAKLHIGKSTTRGLGAGMDPELGRRAAEENQNEIRDALKGSDMVFITCGLGGGTGTGASPIIADIARDLGALTIAVVTKPFAFEGAQRRTIAEKGLSELNDKLDAIITIPNDRVLQIIDQKTTLLEAFGVVNEVLRQGVQGISEIITVPGRINVDFADVKAVMKETGSALMGIGEGTGEGRAVTAANAAIASPLLEVSIEGARGLLFNITGGRDMTMMEVNEAAKLITEKADPNAKIIFGTVINEEYKDRMRVTVVATGFGSRPAHASNVSGMGGSTGASKPERTVFSNIFRSTSTTGESSPAAALHKAPSSNRANTSSVAPSPTTQSEEDELEIPAFLRKKMGG